MNPILLEPFINFAGDANKMLIEQIPLTTSLISNPSVLIGGIVLIAVSLIILFILKKIIGNIILGGLAWALAVFVFHIPLPILPSLIIAVIFGPAGIGVMMLLKFFGIF